MPADRLLSSGQVAAWLGVTARRVRALARRRGVGSKFNSTWVFRVEDIDKLRPGKPGRPRTAAVARGENPERSGII